MAHRRRFSGALGILLVTLSTAGAGCIINHNEALTPPTSPPPLPSAAQPRSTADIVAAAQPSVVLLLNEHEAKDGVPASTTFGAGFLTHDGLVITSLHVVSGDGKLSAMLWKPGRQSYTPMDGGLGRFLFENQADLVPAELIASDGMTDLAVLKLKADTSHLPQLAWSSEDVRPGDRVLALGHPQETVWSFSEGVVGALQFGIVQHTAIVGPGSSGGPLLNAKGEVIGVNVAKVMNQPTGLSFARPIAIVASTFGDKKISSPLDQTTPAGAALSCWRAQMLAVSETADCFDWDHEWEQFRASAEEARRLATTSAVREKIDSCHLGPQAKAAWIAKAREHVIHVLDPAYQAAKTASKKADDGEDDHDDHDHDHDDQPEMAGSLSCSIEASRHADSKFIADYRDPKRLAERLRNGLRAEQTSHVSEDLAWVLLASRGSDGSVANFTELYARVNGRWVQRMLPSASEIASLPKAWVEPVMTYAIKRPLQISAILREAANMDRCPFGPNNTDAASSAGGSGRAVLRLGFSAEPNVRQFAP